VLVVKNLIIIVKLSIDKP